MNLSSRSLFLFSNSYTNHLVYVFSISFLSDILYRVKEVHVGVNGIPESWRVRQPTFSFFILYKLNTVWVTNYKYFTDGRPSCNNLQGPFVLVDCNLYRISTTSNLNTSSTVKTTMQGFRVSTPYPDFNFNSIHYNNDSTRLSVVNEVY